MKRGSALAVILPAMLALTLLVGAVLYVTSRSREISSAYSAAAGAYDMALAGNGHVLSIFHAALKAPVEYEDETARREGIADKFEEELAANGFVDKTAFFELEWSVSVTSGITESFNGETTVERDGVNFIITATVTKDGSYPAAAKLIIDWGSPGTLIDGAYTPMIKSTRISL